MASLFRSTICIEAKQTMFKILANTKVSRQTRFNFSTPGLPDLEMLVAEADSSQLACKVSGQGNPMMLLHGYGGNRNSWSCMIENLVDNHRIYAMDLKGFGKSAKPADYQYSIYHQAALIIRYMMDNHVWAIDIMAHSYGGAVALVVALYFQRYSPKRIGKLILINGISYEQKMPWFVKVASIPLIGETLQRSLPSQWQVEQILRDIFYDTAQIDARLVEKYAPQMKMPGALHALTHTARQVKPVDMAELGRRYTTIQNRTLILASLKDKVVPLENNCRLSKEMPNSEIHFIDDCGHAPQEECISRIIPVIRSFLNQGTFTEPHCSTMLDKAEYQPLETRQ